MSLVADYGSDSEEDESSNEKTSLLPNEVTPKLNITVSENKSENDNNKEESIPKVSNEINVEVNTPTFESDLFSNLPQRKTLHNLEDSEDQIEDFIPKSVTVKEKQKVKISIPSLSDFKDDEVEPNKKKIKLSTKGSGLLSLLPPVKGSVKTAKSFVPNAVANKNKIPASLPPKKVSRAIHKKDTASKHKMLLMKNKASTNNLSESEDEDIEMPETFDDEMWLKVCGKQKLRPVIKEPVPLATEISVEIAPEPEKPYDGLNNEAFKELVGKTKRPIGNIKLIDINEEEILPDKDIWMTKSLTDPELAPKPTVEDPVDPTRRKKHHITYLAQQAKANEQELANAWAASKNSRLASRAKYGF